MSQRMEGGYEDCQGESGMTRRWLHALAHLLWLNFCAPDLIIVDGVRVAGERCLGCNRFERFEE